METAASYREFEPCQALRPYVRAFFSFTTVSSRVQSSHQRQSIRDIAFGQGQPCWSRLFADAHTSIVFSLGSGYCIDNLWHPPDGGPTGHVIGAMDRARAASHGQSVTQMGAYFRAGACFPFTSVPASELTGRIAALSDLWGCDAEITEAGICLADNEAQRVDRLEQALLDRLRRDLGRQAALNVTALAASVLTRRGRVTVRSLAASAGVSRQYLTRIFRENSGVTPKLYCRLARFQAALAHASRAEGVDWARAAAETGYADQSHMISEFRQFSGVTPDRLATERQFHPFISNLKDE
jgi:AraC-like DNA-binding protein